MSWKRHFGLEGKHAFLSPSNSAWANYDRTKLRQRLETVRAAQKGSELHELAHRLIKLKVKLPEERRTLNLYVNDALALNMTSEQMLYYSYNCFGTADAISFENKFLRIHDLKTGISKVNIRQLEIYAALFCLEYNVDPDDIYIELRIYKDDDIQIYPGDAERVAQIKKYMSIIEDHNDEIDLWREENA